MGDKKDSLGWCKVSELHPEFVDQWRDLLEDSLSANIYLSPDFILTALDTFCGASPHVVWAGSSGQLNALAVLEKQQPTLRFPVPSYKLFKSIHSLQTGLLLRRGIEDEELDAFMRTLFDHCASSLYVEEYCPTSEAAQRIDSSARRLKAIWHETGRYERAVLNAGMTLQDWRETRPKKTRKEAARTRRRLKEIAPLSWRFVSADDIDDKSIETFLELEHQSWKGDQGDSLLSDPREADFFRRIVHAFRASDAVFFTEMLLGDEVIASTVNFRTGDTAFAFKVASKRDLSKFAPGILNEIDFVRHTIENEVPFTLVDSGAASGSYIESLWPGRIPMVSGYYLRGRRLALIGSLLGIARKTKRVLRRRRGPT